MNIRKISGAAFPKEHGSYGLTYEPLLTAIIIAYSFAGLTTALAVFLIFLSHQPVRILLNKKIIAEKKRIALFPLAVYAFAISFLLYSAFASGSIDSFIPFFSGIFLMLIFLAIELLGFGRILAAEFVAPTAIGLIAATVTLLGGFSVEATFGFLILIYSRSFTTIFYVNEKLLLQKGNKITKVKTRISEAFFFILLIYLSVNSVIPVLSLAAPALIFLRAEYGLAKRRKSDAVRKVGIYEFFYGVIFVVIVSISYLFS
ncbi:MAG: YwiC-like family protein [Chlorobi bacterium]|nr:YwiC-like family protein [Chlorobiota bacterium]